MLTDLHHLWRSLRRSRASTVAAILTLSLTLGTGTFVLDNTPTVSTISVPADGSAWRTATLTAFSG